MADLINRAITAGVKSGLWTTSLLIRSGLLAIGLKDKQAAKAEQLGRLALIAESSGFGDLGTRFRVGEEASRG